MLEHPFELALQEVREACEDNSKQEVHQEKQCNEQVGPEKQRSPI